MNWKLLGPSPKKWTDNYKCATAARGHNTLHEPLSLLDLEDTAESSFCLLRSVPAEPATFGDERIHTHGALRETSAHDASQADRIHARRLAGCPAERCDRTAP